MLVVVDAYLDKQEEVGVLALGGGPLALLDVVFFNINTLGCTVSRLVHRRAA